MRRFNIIYAAAALLMGLTACELKEEIKKKPGVSEEMGRLALDLSVKNTTKATKSSSEASDFPVLIQNKETGETTKSFDSYAELLEQNPIELPVGTYSVIANSPGEFGSIMTYPYFKGNQDVKIEKDMSAETNVICKMQNLKFGMSLSPDFTTSFETYAITVVYGGSVVHDLKETTKGNYSPVYFKMDNNTTQINLKVIATTFDGVKIDYDVPLTKGSADVGQSGSIFEGGDALNITLKPTIDVDPDDPTPEVPGVGIKVTVAFTFAETEETIVIEINGSDFETPDEPEIPEDGEKPTLSCEFFDKAYVIGEEGKLLDVLITAPEGIQNLKLKIKSTNDGFGGIINQMGLADCDMANLSEELKEGLSDPAIGLIDKDVEIKGQTSYTFSIGAIVNGMLRSYPGTHDFTIEVVDSKGNSSSAKTISIIAK